MMTATAFTLAAVLVLGSAAQLGIAVVCVGFDGHIDIESLLEGCCISGNSNDLQGNVGLVLAGSACGDCTDVQLKAPRLRSKESRLSAPGLSTGSIPCSRSSLSARSVRPADAADTDQRRQTLKPLTTVVLQT